MGKGKMKLKQTLENAKDIMLLSSQIEIISNRQMTIQGSKGIVEYNDDSIRINLDEQELIIYGNNLALESLSQDSLEIKGRITRLEFV